MNKQIAARYCLLAIGVLIMALGIVLITKTDLGTPPISSPGYVLSIAFPQISYGTFVFAWNITLLLGQVVILRRDFKLSALLQIPISVVFGLGIDGFNVLLAFFSPQAYWQSLVLLAAGIVVLALGVACTVVANVAMNCGEALVAAITSKTGWNFGHTKVGFDLSCVCLATITSLVLLGSVQGVREGTLAAASITGFVVNVFIRLLGGPREPLG